MPLIVTSIGSGGKALYEMYESTQKMVDAIATAGESGFSALFSKKIGIKPSKHNKDFPEEKEIKQENPKDQDQKPEEDTNKTDSKSNQSNQKEKQNNN